MIPPSLPFNPAKDKLVICGLEEKDGSLTKAVKMTCKTSVKGIHQMVGFTCLKKNNVVGKVLQYKYQPMVTVVLTLRQLANTGTVLRKCIA